MTYEPTFLGYQILGDSQLLRFSKRFSASPRRKSNGDSSSALCVSGQKIEDLLRRIRENETQISERLILMIGTNDILKKTGFEKMSFLLDRILLQLIKYGATHIIVLTIPPIPKLDGCEYHWKTLKKFNEFIKKRHNGKDIFAIDAYTKFIRKSEKIESKPFGLSQHVNRIVSDLNESAITFYSKKTCNGNQRSSLEDDESLFATKKPDESETWLQGYPYVYNPLSDYTCDTVVSSEVNRDCIDIRYFETHFERNNKIDLIHLNTDGLEQIRQLIVDENYIKLSKVRLNR